MIFFLTKPPGEVTIAVVIANPGLPANPSVNTVQASKNTFMILITHHTGEPHGLLGVQVAATYLTKKLARPSMVVGVERQFSTERLLDFIEDYYQGKKRVIGFSHLCGRKDLIAVIGAARSRGYFTILGGPQAKVDFYGEAGAATRPHRFQGLQNTIDLAIQGPVDALKEQDLDSKTGCLRLPLAPRD